MKTAHSDDECSGQKQFIRDTIGKKIERTNELHSAKEVTKKKTVIPNGFI